MGSSVSIPSSYSISLSGGVDADLDNMKLRVLETPPIAFKDDRIPQISTTSSMSVEKLPVFKISVEKLPEIRISTDADIGMKPTRVHMPMNMHLGLRFLGLPLFDLELCGENQMIVEPYKARGPEICL